MSPNVLPEKSEELEQFWSQRYESGQTGWDLGAVSPPLKHWIDIWTSENMQDRPVLLPGCGNAYEANYLLENGFQDVTVVDIAWPAIHRLQQRVSEQSAEHLAHLSTVHGNFFDLKDRYSLILEQTFFCALDPSLRQPYVQKMHGLLEEQGELAGVLFDAPMHDHRPPFGGTAAEYRELFAPYFDFLTWESCSISHPARQGSELLFRLRKRS